MTGRGLTGVRGSAAVLAVVVLGAAVLVWAADGPAAAAAAVAVGTAGGLVVLRYAAGGGALDSGYRKPVRLLGSRAPALGAWRRVVSQTLADQDGLHFRTEMRPQLQRLFAARLAQRHGVSMYRSPQQACALVGPGLWPWIDPGAAPPQPVLPEPVLRALLDRLEAL